MTHALLSASSAHRWLACPPSMRLCLSYEDVSSTFAQEGTDAHALAQYMLEKALGLDSEDPTGSLSYYSDEMKDHAENYAAFVMEELQRVKETCKDPLILIEQKLDFSEFVPEGYGFVDCLIIEHPRSSTKSWRKPFAVEPSIQRPHPGKAGSELRRGPVWRPT